MLKDDLFVEAAAWATRFPSSGDHSQRGSASGSADTSLRGILERRPVVWRFPLMPEPPKEGDGRQQEQSLGSEVKNEDQGTKRKQETEHGLAPSLKAVKEEQAEGDLAADDPDEDLHDLDTMDNDELHKRLAGLDGLKPNENPAKRVSATKLIRLRRLRSIPITLPSKATPISKPKPKLQPRRKRIVTKQLPQIPEPRTPDSLVRFGTTSMPVTPPAGSGVPAPKTPTIGPKTSTQAAAKTKNNVPNPPKDPPPRRLLIAPPREPPPLHLLKVPPREPPPVHLLKQVAQKHLLPPPPLPDSWKGMSS